MTLHVGRDATASPAPTSDAPDSDDAIQATLRRVLSRSTYCLPAGDGEQLSVLLRSHIAYLCPKVQTYADTLNKGTGEWYCLQVAIDTAYRSLGEETPAHGLAATQRIDELARTCRFLLTHVPPTSRTVWP